jgi:hypothetical protein
MGGAGSGFAWRILPANRFANARRTTAPAAYGRRRRRPSHPHNDDPVLLYDWDKSASLTKVCHDRKTTVRDGGFGNPVRR